MDYPQLHIPRNIREIITTNHFPKPNKPAEPKEPIKENNLNTKIIFGIIGLIIYKCDYEIIGILVILACLYWIYRNPEKISYEKAYEAYEKSYEKYSKEYDNFSNELNLYTNKPTEYNNNYRKRSLRKSLIASSSSCYEKDYKKGVTHDFFKIYLKKYFADKISEDTAIKKYKFNGYYSHNDYKPYVTDFAYINKNTGLSIDIEIDEPYTLSKKPIHLNDLDRNNFF